MDQLPRLASTLVLVALGSSVLWVLEGDLPLWTFEAARSPEAIGVHSAVGTLRAAQSIAARRGTRGIGFVLAPPVGSLCGACSLQARIVRDAVALRRPWALAVDDGAFPVGRTGSTHSPGFRRLSSARSPLAHVVLPTKAPSPASTVTTLDGTESDRSSHRLSPLSQSITTALQVKEGG
jgi:hypothetical protein